MNILIELLGVFGGVATLLGIWHWFYKKQPSVKIIINSEADSISVSIRNHKDVDVRVKSVLLVKKKRFRKKLEYDKNSFHRLVDFDTSDISFSQNDDLDILIKSNSPALDLQISFSNINSLYDHFLPYKISKTYSFHYLEKAVLMPKCYIAIVLDSGKYKLIALPKSFYSFYKNFIGREAEPRLKDLEIRFCNNKERIEFNEWMLTRYEISRRNYYRLLEK